MFQRFLSSIRMPLLNREKNGKKIQSCDGKKIHAMKIKKRNPSHVRVMDSDQMNRKVHQFDRLICVCQHKNSDAFYQAEIHMATSIFIGIHMTIPMIHVCFLILRFLHIYLACKHLSLSNLNQYTRVSIESVHCRTIHQIMYGNIIDWFYCIVNALLSLK